MAQTLEQLRTKVFGLIWASHQPENLIENHKLLVNEALSEIQENVPCERERNANVTLFCNTHFKCGVTILPAVRGIIKFLYTIPNGDWCCPIFYRQGTLKEVLCFAPPRTWEEPATPDDPRLSMGFASANASRDNPDGRAKCGMFAIHDRNIWISPAIHSSEQVVIEWSGKKSASQWTPDDPVSEELDFEKAVTLYVSYGHERDYGKPEMALFFRNPQRTGEFDDALSDLMIRCHEETRIRNDEVCRPCPCYVTVDGEVTPPNEVPPGDTTPPPDDEKPPDDEDDDDDETPPDDDDDDEDTEPEMFGNVAVYWTCEVGTLAVTATLPAWITFDEANNRLVGRAGEYQRTTQLAADFAAEAALNIYAATLITADALTCTPPVTCEEGDIEAVTWSIVESGGETVVFDTAMAAAAGHYGVSSPVNEDGFEILNRAYFRTNEDVCYSCTSYHRIKLTATKTVTDNQGSGIGLGITPSADPEASDYSSYPFHAFFADLTRDNTGVVGTKAVAMSHPIPSGTMSGIRFGISGFFVEGEEGAAADGECTFTVSVSEVEIQETGDFSSNGGLPFITPSDPTAIAFDEATGRWLYWWDGTAGGGSGDLIGPATYLTGGRWHFYDGAYQIWYAWNGLSWVEMNAPDWEGF